MYAPGAVERGWIVIDVHAIPLNDLLPHAVDSPCWCDPAYDPTGAVIHNALDDREELEDLTP